MERPDRALVVVAIYRELSLLSTDRHDHASAGQPRLVKQLLEVDLLRGRAFPYDSQRHQSVPSAPNMRPSCSSSRASSRNDFGPTPSIARISSSERAATSSRVTRFAA